MHQISERLYPGPDSPGIEDGGLAAPPIGRARTIRATFVKNFLLQWRAPCSTCCAIVFPILLVVMLAVALRQINKVDALLGPSTPKVYESYSAVGNSSAGSPGIYPPYYYFSWAPGPNCDAACVNRFGHASRSEPLQNRTGILSSYVPGMFDFSHPDHVGVPTGFPESVFAPYFEPFASPAAISAAVSEHINKYVRLQAYQLEDDPNAVYTIPTATIELDSLEVTAGGVRMEANIAMPSQFGLSAAITPAIHSGLTRWTVMLDLWGSMLRGLLHAVHVLNTKVQTSAQSFAPVLGLSTSLKPPALLELPMITVSVFRISLRSFLTNVATIFATILPWCVLAIIPLMVSRLIEEKSRSMIRLARVNGLSVTSWIFANVAYFLGFSMVSSALTIGAFAVTGSVLWRDGSRFLLVLLFVLGGLSAVTTALLIVALLCTPRLAIYATTILLLGTMTMATILNILIWNPLSGPSRSYPDWINVFPYFALTRAFVFVTAQCVKVPGSPVCPHTLGSFWTVPEMRSAILGLVASTVLNTALATVCFLAGGDAEPVWGYAVWRAGWRSALWRAKAVLRRLQGGRPAGGVWEDGLDSDEETHDKGVLAEARHVHLCLGTALGTAPGPSLSGQPVVADGGLASPPDLGGLMVCGLTRTYRTGAGTLTAVHPLYLHLRAGEACALLGPNGAGKSTLMRMLVGVDLPTDGTAVIDGETDLLGSYRKYTQRLGYCAQHTPHWPQLTCREHLLYFARLKGVPARSEGEHVEGLMRAMDLGEYSAVRMGNLSGGQRRRIGGIATAFTGAPSIVALDEPTTGLDPATKRKIWGFLRERARTSHCTLLLCTHDLAEAEAVCGRIAIMGLGHLLAIGTGTELRQRYCDGFDIALQVSPDLVFTPVSAWADGSVDRYDQVGGASTLPGQSDTADGLPSRVHTWLRTVVPEYTVVEAYPPRYRIKIGSESIRRTGFSALFRALMAQSAENGVIEWGIMQPTLDDVFASVMGTKL